MNTKTLLVAILFSSITTILLAQDKYSVEVRRVVIELKEAKDIGWGGKFNEGDSVRRGLYPISYSKEFRSSSSFYDSSIKEQLEKSLSKQGVSVSGYDHIFAELRKNKTPKYAISFVLKSLIFNYSGSIRYKKFHSYVTFQTFILDLTTNQIVYDATHNSEFFSNEIGQPAGKGFLNYFIGMYDKYAEDLMNDSKFIKLITKTEKTADSLSANEIIIIPQYAKSLSMQQALDATVTLKTGSSHGSGAIITTDGLILTCQHVVNASEEVDVILSNGMTVKAKVIRSVPEYDLALLQLTDVITVPIHISKSQEVITGQDAWVIGTPGFTDLGQTVSKGIISGNRTIDEKNYLQTDASVSPGNSGGPLLNENLEIIGIVNAKIVSAGMEGIGFAIPVSVALEKLNIVVE